ncbi:bgs3 [Symbiodinium microadriaticum]|nr:bgs3 [Symbiodinium microadriaticum]
MGFLQGSYLTANLVSTRNWYDSVSMASLLNEVHISTGWGAVGSWDVRLVDGFAGMRIGDLAASGVDATSACCACGGGVSGRPCEQRVNGQLPFQARGDVAGSTEGSRRLSGLGGFASDPLLLGKPGTDGFSLSLNFTSCAVTQESDPSGDWCTLEAVVAPGMAKSRVITPLASVWTQILDPGCRIMGHHQVGSSYMWQATGCNMTAGGLYVVALHLTTSQGDVLLLMDLQIPGKPTYTPSSVVFSDSDVRRGYLLGEVTIEGAEDESNILQYRAYYGRSNDTRVNFLSDERAAGIGWVNTYADGGLRNGYNNECLYGDCSWKMELSKTAGNGRPYNQYLIRHEHTGKCLCYANAVLSQTECYANLLTVDSPTAYKYLPSGNGALIDRNNELYKTVWYRDIGDRATKTLESVLAIMQQAKAKESKEAKVSEDELRAELRELIQAQAAWNKEVLDSTEDRDSAAAQVAEAEALLAAEHEAIEDLERECHSLDQRLSQAKAEEANWTKLADNVVNELESLEPRKGNGKDGNHGNGKDGKGRKGTKRSDKEPVSLGFTHSQLLASLPRESAAVKASEDMAGLRAAVAAERRRAEVEDAEAEQKKRQVVEQQCMLLRALLDMVTGSGELSKSETATLVQQLAGLERLSEEHPLAWSLLAQQAESNGVARRELLETCNQELRRRRRSAEELLDAERLPLLLKVLEAEGLLSGSWTIPEDSGLTARLQRRVIRDGRRDSKS